MAFKKIEPTSNVPDSPEKLFLDLPRRKIPDVLPHQREIMRIYAKDALEKSDVALQLPTGSGKTLVGLLIGEWRRRKYRDRIVYLCPTRQLVNQVVEQAEERYGLTVLGFTGSISDYTPLSKAEYRNADRVAVTTYSSLFNINPFFSDADILIMDDAHSSEGYIASLWSIQIERNKPEHASLHAAICGLLRPLIDPILFTRLSGQWESIADRLWVDKLNTPMFTKILNEVVEILDSHAKDAKLEHSWSMIRDHLNACQLYFSSQGILIRPLISPTWTHPPFQNPKQRIYMSATLGLGGDLERLTGRKSVHRLPIPEGWDRQGVGRRFFIFPDMSLKKEMIKKLRISLISCAGRSLILVPNDHMAKEITEDIMKHHFKVFNATDIEISKKTFISESAAVAVVANRYDGIDFPGDECRLLFVEGLPKATNLQELFLMTRMGANVLFNERIQTRVLQAIGRCTRSLEDYSAVVVSGGELVDYLTDIRKRGFLHPELQAELKFGVEQSKDTSMDNTIDNFKVFLENGKDWEEINQQIVSLRREATQIPFPVMGELSGVVKCEIEFQFSLWHGDYETAMNYAESVLGGLDSPELRGYRALWHYLAGSAAWLGVKSGIPRLESKALSHFEKAKNATKNISWLVDISRYKANEVQQNTDDSILSAQIELVEMILAQLGTMHDRNYSRREKEILDGLNSKDKGPFEQAHKLLGEFLGFNVGKVESDGSPDPYWIAGNLCIVFEDHAGASAESVLDVHKARQVSSHPAWIKANVKLCENSEILAVLVSPVTKVREGATPHLEKVALWSLDGFKEWACEVISVIRQLRKTFPEPGNLDWRQEAVQTFKTKGFDMPTFFNKLRSQSANKLLSPEK